MSETPLWDQWTGDRRPAETIPEDYYANPVNIQGSNEGLSYLLGQRGRVSQIGHESGPNPSNGVAAWKGSHGGVRFVVLSDGEVVAAIQIMDRPAVAGRWTHAAIVANAYTKPSERRRGHASRLLALARLNFGHLIFGDDRSGDGQALVESQPEGKSGSRKSNPDESERILERAAKLGDVRAQRKLDQMRARRGVKKSLTWGVVPEFEEFREHTAAIGIQWPVTYGSDDVERLIILDAVTGLTALSSGSAAWHRQVAAFKKVTKAVMVTPRIKSWGLALEIHDAAEAHMVILGLVNLEASLERELDAAHDEDGEPWPGMDLQEITSIEERLEHTRSLASSIMEVVGYEWI